MNINELDGKTKLTNHQKKERDTTVHFLSGIAGAGQARLRACRDRDASPIAGHV